MLPKSAAAIFVTSLVLTAPVARVLAWTPEVEIFPTVVSASEPDLTVAPDGSIHLVFAGQVGSDSQQHIYYTRWNGTSWASLVNLPGPDLKEQQPDIAVGPDGHVHVVAIYRDCGEVTCPYTVFCWEWNGSGWTGPVPLSPNTGGDDNSCSSAKVAVDKNNDLHVVWAQKGATGGESDIMYKKRQSGIWLPTYNMTNNNGGTSYGSVSCDLAIDKNGPNIHVVWHDDFLNNGFQAYYTKNTDLGASASWLPGNQWYQLSSGSYGKVPRVWLDRDNHPNIVWIDKLGGSENKTAYRRFDGANWTIPQNWGSWSVHEAAFDASNIMHFLYVDSGVSPWELYYSAYNRATDSRSPGQLISAGANTMKVDFASMAMEASGAVHTIWEERKNPGDAGVYYSTNFSLNAPADVVSFSVNASDGVNRLYWRNPGSANFNGTMIRFKTTGFPTGPGDGMLLVDKVATLNSSDSTTHSGLTNGQTYYYAAFTHDALGHYSTGANFAADPHKLRCSEIKRFENNTLIDLTDKIVTASFPAQSAIYIQEPDRSSGIRVTTAVASSYQPGDIVSISTATIDTRIVSGVPAERMIKNCTLTKTGVTMAPVPLTFKGINIGGEDIQPYVPGVYGAIGLNNVGQLVKVIGLVRDKISTYLYVDDGSGVVDISGGLGMLVQTPTNPPAPQIGQYISVIGVVEGSVELFSLQSRRFIRARSNADIVIYQ